MKKRAKQANLETEALESRVLLTTQPVLSDFVLFGQNEVDLGAGSRVESGAIGSNDDVISRNETVVNSIYAVDDIRLHNHGISSGSLWANGLVEAQPDSTVAGNIDSGQIVYARARSTIAGNVTSAGNIVEGNGTLILGTSLPNVAPATLNDLVLPGSSSFVTDSANDELTDPDETSTLSPGAYGNLRIKPRNHLTFTAGEYFFDDIHSDQDLTLHMDVSQGPIRVFVDGRILFENTLTMDVIGGDASDVYFETTTNFFLRHHATWTGTIFAPNGQVDVDRDSTFTGTAFAEQVSTGTDVVVNHQPLDPVAVDFLVHESNGGTAISDGGHADELSFTLAAQPKADVLLTLTVNSSDVELETTELLFTPDSWNEPQTVSVELGPGVALTGTQAYAVSAISLASHVSALGTTKSITVGAFDIEQVGAGDFDGDGVEDLFRRVGDTIEVGLNRGSTLSVNDWPINQFETGGPKVGNSVWATANDAIVADFNGDGRDDLLKAEPTAAGWWLARSTGSSFDEVLIPVSGLVGSMFSGAGFEPVVGDFNSDGRADIGYFDSVSSSWIVALSLGTSFRVANWSIGQTPSGGHTVVGDINADSRDDLVTLTGAGSIVVSLSDGNRFINETWASATEVPTLSLPIPQAPIQIGRVNDDERADVLINAGQGEYHVGLSVANSFDFGSWTPLTGFSDEAELRDINKDQQADLVAVGSPNSLTIGLASSSGFIAQDWAMLDGQTWLQALSFDDVQAISVVDYNFRARETFGSLSDIQTSIDFTPSAGLLRDPSVTELSGAGNAFDQAALLVDSVSSAVDTQLLTGRITASGDQLPQLLNWLKVDELPDAFDVLHAAGLNPILQGQSVEFDHAWVQARLPTDSGLAWVDLDPSWKQYVSADGDISLNASDQFWEPSELAFAGSQVDYSYDFDGTSDDHPIQNASLSVTTGTVLTDDNELRFRDSSAVLLNEAAGLDGTITLWVEKAQPGVSLFGRASTGGEYGLRLTTKFIEHDEETLTGGFFYYPGTGTTNSHETWSIEQPAYQEPELYAEIYRRDGNKTHVLESTKIPRAYTEDLFPIDCSQSMAQPYWNGASVSQRTWTIDCEIPEYNEDFSPSDLSLTIEGNTITATVGTHTLTADDDTVSSKGSFGVTGVSGLIADNLAAQIQVPGDNLPSASLLGRHYEAAAAIPLLSHEILAGTPGSTSPFTVQQTSVVGNEWSNSHRHELTVTIKQGAEELFTESVSSADFAKSALSVFVDGDGSNKGVSIDHPGLADFELLVSSGDLTSTDGLSVVIEYFDPAAAAASRSDLYELPSDGVGVVSLNLGHISASDVQELRVEANRVTSFLSSGSNEDRTKEGIASALTLLNADYLSQSSDELRLINAASGAVSLITTPASGFASSSMKLVFDDGNLLYGTPEDIVLDQPSAVIVAVPLGLGGSDSIQEYRGYVSAATTSFLESAVVSAITGTETASATNALRYAAATGQQLFRLRELPSGGFEDMFTGTTGPGLASLGVGFDSDQRQRIKDHLYAGQTVTVSADPVHIGDWDGLAYLLEDDSSVSKPFASFLVGERVLHGADGEDPDPDLGEAIADRFAVDEYSGRFSWTESDVTLPSSIGEAAVSRVWSSTSESIGGFGLGWTMSFDETLTRDTFELTYLDSTGREYTFPRIPGTNDYLSSSTLPGATIQFETNIFTLRFKDGAYRQFKPSGSKAYLSEIGDRHGNKLAINRDSDIKKIDTISDVPVGHTERLLYTFSYDGSLISSVTDLDGRTWNYSYTTLDRAQYLTSVDGPDGVQASTAQQRLAVQDHYFLKDDQRVAQLSKLRVVNKSETNDDRVTYLKFDTSTIGDDGIATLRFNSDLGDDTGTLSVSLGENSSWTSETINETPQNDGVAAPLPMQLLGTLRAKWKDDSWYEVSLDADALRGLDVATLIVSISEDSGPGLRLIPESFELLIEPESVTGSRYTYSQSPHLLGKLDSARTPNSGLQDFEYYGNGRIASISASTGARVGYSNNAFENQVTVYRPGVDAVTQNYSKIGLLDEEVFRDGSRTSHTWDTAQYLRTSTTQAGGRMTSYSYDDEGLGNLVSMQDPSGLVTLYEYEPDFQQLAKTTVDPDTAVIGDERVVLQSTFDIAVSPGNPISTTDAVGHTRGFTYNAQGYMASSTSALGYEPGNSVAEYTTNYLYSPAGQLYQTDFGDSSSRSQTYDNLGRLISEVDETGIEKSYTYDEFDRVVTETSPDPYAVYDPDLALGLLVTRHFYGDNRLLATTVQADGTRTHYSYDSGGRRVGVRYDDGTSRSFSYGTDQLLDSVLDQLGRETTYSYDDFGRRTQTVFADGSVEASAYDAAGNKILHRDRRGFDTHFTFDTSDRLLTKTDAESNTWSTTYDAFGNVASKTGPRNISTVYTHDDLNRAVEARIGNTVVVRTSYDANSNAVQTNRYDISGLTAGEAAGDLDLLSDERKRIQSIEYDIRDRAIRWTDSLGQTQFHEYDDAGRLLASTNARGATTNHYYDGTGNKRETLAPAPAAGEARPRTLYQHDALGRLVAETDPLERVTQFTYDSRGRQVSVINPRGEESFTYYTATGEVAAEENVLGQVTSHVFDEVGRKVLTAGPLIETTVGYQSPVSRSVYDFAGNAVEQYDALGRLTSTEYDALNRAVVGSPPDPDGDGPEQSGSILTSYDADGNVLTQTDQLGRVMTYVYDDLNNVVSTTTSYAATGDSVTATADYDAFGNLIESIDTLGRTTLSEFDARNRVTQTTFADPDGQTGSLDAPTESYTYDPAGNVLTKTDALERVSEYQYDLLDRVFFELTPDPDGSGDLPAMSESHEYDPVGNRISTQDHLGRTTQFQYNELDQQVSQTLQDPDGTGLNIPVYTTNYDSLGNVTSTLDPLLRQTSYYYDSLNREVEVVYPNVSGDGLAAPRSSSTYDLAGNVLTTADAMGRVTSYEYDHQNRLTAQYLPEIVGGNSDQGAPTTLYEYDAIGNQVGSTDTLGNVTTSTYDFLNRVIRVESSNPDVSGPNAVSLTEYDDAGNVLKVTDALGRVTQYEYDDLNRLTKTYLQDPTQFTSSYVNGQVVTMGGGSVVLSQTLEYDDLGNVVASTDAFGRRTETVYDALNRATSVSYVHPDSTETSRPTSTTVYDESGNVGKQIDVLGRETRYEYDDLNRRTKVILPAPDGPSGDLQSPSLTSTHDAVGNVISTINNVGHVTTYEYDELDRVRRTVYPDPDLTDGIASPETTTTYDLVDNVLESVDALFRTTNYEYDALDRVVSTTLPGPQGTGAPGPRTEYSYDLAGNVLTQEDGLGRVITRQYDTWGRLITETLPDPDGSDPLLLSPVSLFVYDLAGQVVATSDHLGRITTSVFDGLGRQIQVTDFDPDGSGQGQAPVYSSQYDFVGNLIGTTDPLGRQTAWNYDEWDRQISQTLPASNGTTVDGPTTFTTYDLAGNVVLVTDAGGKSTEFHFDALDRETMSRVQVFFCGPEAPAQNEVRNEYNDAGYLVQVLKLVDVGEDLATQYHYDRRGRVTTMIDPRSFETKYTYDYADNLLTVEDANQNVTSFTYDDLNRRLSSTNELGDTRSYDYDAVGNLTQYTDRNGRVTTYDYDDLDRSVSETWLDGTAVLETVTATYDDQGNLITTGDTDHEYQYGYDLLDRVTDFTRIDGSGNTTVDFDYSYDLAGNQLLREEHLNGVTVSTEYLFTSRNMMRRVKQFGGGTTTKLANLYYDENDQLEMIIRREGTDAYAIAVSDFSYDEANNLTSIVHRKGSAELATYDFAYDLASRMTESDSLADGQSTFNLDDAGQLTAADHASQSDESYEYDPAGNRVGGGYDVGPNNRMLSDGTYDYEYDAEGNRTKRTSIVAGSYTEYEWDHRNRLTSVTDYAAGGSVLTDVSYGYDIADQRISRSVDSNGDGTTDISETFIVDGDNITSVLDDSGTVLNRYMHGPGVDQVLADEQSNGDVLWLLSDHQGTARDIVQRVNPTSQPTNQTQVTNHRVFDTFGNLQSESDSNVDYRFGFTGRDQDTVTGLYNYRSRWFDAPNGAFLSEDPLGFEAGDSNLTRYVFNSPLDNIDPSGQTAASSFLTLGSGLYDAYQGYTAASKTPDERAEEARRAEEEAKRKKIEELRATAEESRRKAKEAEDRYLEWERTKIDPGLPDEPSLWTNAANTIRDTVKSGSNRAQGLYSAAADTFSDWQSTSRQRDQEVESGTGQWTVPSRSEVLREERLMNLSSDLLGAQANLKQEQSKWFWSRDEKKVELYQSRYDDISSTIGSLHGHEVKFEDIYRGNESTFFAGVAGFEEGYQGGSEIVTNTFTFGASDYLGLTNSESYQGAHYDVSRIAAKVGREALITAATAGAGNALRGGALAHRANAAGNAAGAARALGTLGSPVLRSVASAASGSANALRAIRGVQLVGLGYETVQTGQSAYGSYSAFKNGDKVGGFTNLAFTGLGLIGIKGSYSQVAKAGRTLSKTKGIAAGARVSVPSAAVVHRSGGHPRDQLVDWFDEGAVLNDMRSSPIGRQVVDAAESHTLRLQFSDSHYRATRILGAKEHTNIAGMAFRKTAKVFLPTVRSNGRAAEIAIHEGLHILGVRGSRRAEALVRLASEATHRGRQVTRSEMKRVLREIKDSKLYDDLPWRQGKPGAGKTTPNFPGLEF